ncbi:Tat pathway signal protein [Catellatospora tritici]|uniref:Tat pathway signal protein n=1 Tax=Catellatospora tritici TaxID=2851566 RepID=UPI001C2D7586|nr:Tat pathway signal protein [Catellatospora tritici]MBV1854543.1 Tat pathway signal protein [Catellatospora tritici]
MAQGRQPNTKLAQVIGEARWSHGQVASALVRVAAESGARELAAVSRSHVSHWVAGSHPSGVAPVLLAELLSRRLGRIVTVEDIGLAPTMPPSIAGVDWNLDTLASLADLGRISVDAGRRSLLGAAAYSVAALALPASSWWTSMADRSTERSALGSITVGRGDVEAVREMVLLFSRLDQRRGGGHASSSVVQYLTSDVARYLQGAYADDRVRREMFSAASELAYLVGWMAFDSAEHSAAQHFFTASVKLAAEGDDPAMAAHTLRAMAHQAIDLGHARQGLALAAASMEGDRYRLASPRERALLGVVHARGLAATGNKAAAASALIKAENDLAKAEPGDDEPSRVFFFGEASLAHETGCALRDIGDLPGAAKELRRSVRTRKAATFTRTHAVTLGYLGAVQARQGNLDEACGNWSTALEAMDGIRSARARQTVADMRSALSPFRRRGITTAAELDARAAAYLAATAA